jgi:hypothetical protein
MEFVGAQMANFLYAIADEPSTPQQYRIRAKRLQTKWDSVSRLVLNNPIAAAELEEKFFPEDV